MSYFELNNLQIYHFNVFLIFAFINGSYWHVKSVKSVFDTICLQFDIIKLKLAYNRTDDIFML